jgi:heptaprenyl diphosphate synthase
MRNIKKMTLLANFLAIAIVLNIIESVIQVVPVPGAKLGFANIVTLIVLFVYSFKDSSAVTILRVLMVALISGRFLSPTFYMALSGSVFAVIAMGITKKTNFFGIVGVSVIGSISHAIGQIAAGIFVIGTSLIIYYLPIMLFLSVPAGALTGIIAKRFLVIWKTWHNEIEQ